MALKLDTMCTSPSCSCVVVTPLRCKLVGECAGRPEVGRDDDDAGTWFQVSNGSIVLEAVVEIVDPVVDDGGVVDSSILWLLAFA
jgi:hypothetical protein